MRDLFRFLLRIRDTLLFLALMTASLLLLHGGNMHHRAQAISTSNAVVGTLYTWRAEITGYTGLRTVNQRLAEENARLRSLLAAATAIDTAGPPARDTGTTGPFVYLTARVVNGTWHKQRNFITLDKGALAGVHPDMGVIGPGGIAGVVRDVSPRFASAISVLNVDLRTSVQVRRTGHFGLLYWNTGDPTTASVVDIPKHARIAAGDTVETRGGDGIFPPGVPVGVVIDVVNDPGKDFLDVRIALAEDLTRAGYVHLVTDRLRPERDSLQAQHAEP
jgi:rod shape-determining protein MreC